MPRIVREMKLKPQEPQLVIAVLEQRRDDHTDHLEIVQFLNA